MKTTQLVHIEHEDYTTSTHWAWRLHN